MIASQIQENLTRLFKQDRIVFWYDSNAEFRDEVETLELEAVSVLRLDKLGALEIKTLLEMEDKVGNYLLYAPFRQPEDQENWLLDIQIYSRVFQADYAAVILDELGLTCQAMHSHIQKRQSFFQNKERLARIKKLVKPTDNEESLDLKMLAVITKTLQTDFLEILIRLFASFLPEESDELFNIDFTQDTREWQQIAKFDLEPTFWGLVSGQFGYVREAGKRSLQDLLFCLMTTDFELRLEGTLPSSLRYFVIDDKLLSHGASVFLDRWRQHNSFCNAYNQLSEYVADEMKIGETLSEFSAESLHDVMTFSVIEKFILSDLRDRLVDYANGGTNPDISSIILCRKEGHWAGNQTGNDQHFRLTYVALEAADKLFTLRWEYPRGFDFSSAAEAFLLYSRSLFKFDQYYRLFSEKAVIVTNHATFDILKTLSESIEDCYCGWYLNQLAIAWSKLLDGEKGLLSDWRLEGIENQYDFYRTNIHPLVSKAQDRKVFVIISDAFRYEIADELKNAIARRKRLEAQLQPMLGVLPSYTALGMASLLPHKELSFTSKARPEITVDGQPCSSLEQRNSILEKYRGLAVKAEALIKMKKQEGRDFVKDKQVIYIYHDQIDSKGDHAASESETFSAARDAIKDLDAIAKYVVNNLNATTVFVTADHGFLYTETSPEEIDKSKIDMKPAGTQISKKRYLLGRNLGDAPNVIKGKCEVTARARGDMEFWIPRGVNRFHFVSGARFIHGGAMPQEIVVPLLTIKQLKGKAGAKSQIKKVSVTLLDHLSKITNSTQRFTFIQNDSISDKIKPITLHVVIENESGLAVSTEKRILFDSQSNDFEERKRAVRLVIDGSRVNRKESYNLVWRDTENMTEKGKHQLKIDLAFGRDF